VKLTIFTTLTSSWPRGAPRGPIGKLPIYVIVLLVGLVALSRLRPLRKWSSATARSGFRRWLSFPRLAACLALALLLLEGGCRSTVNPTGTPTGNFSIAINGTLNSNTAVIRTTIVNLAVACPPASTCP
jgi:hypothetical protein